MSTPLSDSTAVVPSAAPAVRDVDTVPFVELFNNRVQGVVSASSDPNRVYCAFLEGGTGNYYSSTNNNRRDAGIPKHLGQLLSEASRQFGRDRVDRFLGGGARMQRERAEPAGTVFTRFLNYLRHVELPSADGPMPEMSWFVCC